MKDEKQNNWSEKDAFLEARAKTLLKVIDDLREDYGTMSEYVTLKQSILTAFGKINAMRERLFDSEKAKPTEIGEVEG
jgi:hypothetical protein